MAFSRVKMPAEQQVLATMSAPAFCAAGTLLNQPSVQDFIDLEDRDLRVAAFQV